MTVTPNSEPKRTEYLGAYTPTSLDCLVVCRIIDEFIFLDSGHVPRDNDESTPDKATGGAFAVEDILDISTGDKRNSALEEAVARLLPNEVGFIDERDPTLAIKYPKRDSVIRVICDFVISHCNRDLSPDLQHPDELAIHVMASSLF